MVTIDYGSIVRRSIEITKKAKWLWIYGIVLASLAGGSGNFNFPDSSGSSSTTEREVEKSLPESLQETGQEVLGQATNILTNWLGTVPPVLWVATGIGLLFLILLGIVVNIIIQSWAKGALIKGLSETEAGKEVGLGESSKWGISQIRNLAILALISFGVGVAVVIVLMVLGVVAVIFFAIAGAVGGGAGALMTLVLVLLSVLGFLAILIVMVILGMVGIYADRLVVLKGMTPWEAWKKGLSLSKGNFFPTVVMGLINGVLGCVFGCVASLVIIMLAAVPGIVFFLPAAISNFNPGVVVFSGAGIVVLVILGLAVNLAVRGVIVVFNFNNWNLVFKEVLEKEGTTNGK